MGPENSNNKWTPEEDARLKSLIEANTSIHLVAAKLKRSVPATRARAAVLNILIRRVWVGLKAKKTPDERRLADEKRARTDQAGTQLFFAISRIEKGPHFRDPRCRSKFIRDEKQAPGKTRLEFSTGPDIRTNTVRSTVLIHGRARHTAG
jgi:hypothetical protein